MALPFGYDGRPEPSTSERPPPAAGYLAHGRELLMRQTVSGAARAAAAVTVAALALAACSSIDTPAGGGQSPSADNRSAKTGGTLVVALSDEPDALDPTT